MFVAHDLTSNLSIGVQDKIANVIGEMLMTGNALV